MDTAEDLESAKQLIKDLQLEMDSLRNRIQSLEVENACLKEQLKSSNNLEGIKRSPKADKHKTKISKDEMVQSLGQCRERFVALKLLYFGKRFYGFASEAMMEPTVESELFAALKKTRLLLRERHDAQYSRCGRTDKGVSAFGQVVSLYLRSRDKEGEEQIDYVRVLNRALPSDIRVTGWCTVSAEFHSRFSCRSREYKYYFLKENLDIREMQVACSKFVGDHDFRNFCKMDARNVHNYRRNITSFEIISLKERWAGTQVMVMQIKGSAFLWHQVRCMAAVLFMIGHHLESPKIIEEMLDTSKVIRKPQYNIASELPLVLESCEFEGLSFHCSSDAAKELSSHLYQKHQTYLLQTAIYHEASSQFLPIDDCVLHKKMHIPLSLRATEPTYDERQKKLREKYNTSNGDSNNQNMVFPGSTVSDKPC